MAAPLDAKAIAQTTCYSTDGDSGWKVAYGQTRHRIEIISHFNIQPGSNVLEVGCGQGDFTVVLAAVVGKNGHVTAVDPASLDYGTPTFPDNPWLWMLIVCNREPIHARASPKSHIKGGIWAPHHMGAKRSYILP
jgi:hypothetical protein